MSQEINTEIKKLLLVQDELAKKFWNLLEHIWNKKGNLDNTPNVVKLWFTAVRCIQAINPHHNIKETGAFFWKYKDQIINNDSTWMLEHNWEKQMQDWKDIITNFSPALCNNLDSTLIKIRDFLNGKAQEMNNEKSRKAGAEICKTLLSWYSRYSIIDQEVKDLKIKLKQV